jgi:hypothetical protein
VGLFFPLPRSSHPLSSCVRDPHPAALWRRKGPGGGASCADSGTGRHETAGAKYSRTSAIAMDIVKLFCYMT